jgi:hypothetical protein
MRDDVIFRSIYDYNLHRFINIDGDEVRVQRNHNNTFWLNGVPHGTLACANEVFLRVNDGSVSLFCCEMNFATTAIQTCLGSMRGVTMMVALDPNSIVELIGVNFAPRIPMEVDQVGSQDSQLTQSF